VVLVLVGEAEYLSPQVFEALATIAGDDAAIPN
jgi:hypothetical protein